MSTGETGSTAAGGGALAPSLSCYDQFVAAVSRRQLTAWLSDFPGDSVIVDLTPEVPTAVSGRPVVALSTRGRQPREGERIVHVHAEAEHLACLRTGSVDAVVAERGALPYCIATEDMLRNVRRVLRPGGRLLLCVDSLAYGLSQLAAQSRWAELADAPHADVVLVPGVDGSITRCFTADELAEALQDAGFGVEWIRPRTVLSRDAVNRATSADQAAFARLVNVELDLASKQAGEVPGACLLASAARKP